MRQTPINNRSNIYRLAAVWLGAICAVAGTGVSFADVLVTQDGNTIETRGPWEIKGRQVVFTDNQGRLSALRLNDVDLEASKEATYKAANPEPEAPAEEPEEPKEVKPVMVFTNDNIGPARGGGGDYLSGITEQSDLRVALGINGYGYRVQVRVNGRVLPGFSEEGSQAVQLFHVNHPNRAKMEGSPQDRQYLDLFCLVKGSNQLDVDFELIEGAAGTTPVHIYINANHYSVPILDFQQKERGTGSLSTSFQVEEAMPAGFSTLVPSQ